jgi:hypothetical protein
MGLYGNPYAIPGFLAMLVAFALAAFVYFAAPGGQQANRRLSFILLLEGCATGAGNALIYSVDTEPLARASQAVSIAAVLLLPAAYLYFLGTIDSPLSRWLGTRAGDAVTFLVGVGSVGTFFLYPERFLVGAEPVTYANARFDGILGPWYSNFGYLRLAILLFSFVVALHAYLRSTTALGKQRAKAFAIAFGVWDASRMITSFLFFAIIPRLSGDSSTISATGTTWIDMFGVWVYPITMILFAPLLAWGILKTQLFDIDLKIRRFTVNKGFLASGALLCFFVTAQAIESFLGNQLGILGGVIAGGLFFLLSPIQKAAERLAERATHGAKSVGQMSAKERLHLYQEQLEFAFADGGVSKKERMLLEHLRNRLGVERDAAQKLEKQFLTSMGFTKARASPA